MLYFCGFVLILFAGVVGLIFISHIPEHTNNTEIADVIKVLRTERECVSRNEHNECDRDCEHCDLVMDGQYILDAYDKAIEIVEKYDKIRKEIGYEQKENGDN